MKEHELRDVFRHVMNDPHVAGFEGMELLGKTSQYIRKRGVKLAGIQQLRTVFGMCRGARYLLVFVVDTDGNDHVGIWSGTVVDFRMKYKWSGCLQLEKKGGAV